MLLPLSLSYQAKSHITQKHQWSHMMQYSFILPEQIEYLLKKFVYLTFWKKVREHRHHNGKIVVA